ncbi:MAG: hypothetical protein ACRD6N_08505 [Pyrinomonadaceae bacterium]
MKRSEPWVTQQPFVAARETGGRALASELLPPALAGWGHNHPSFTQGSLCFTLGFMLPPAPQAGFMFPTDHLDDESKGH